MPQILWSIFKQDKELGRNGTAKSEKHRPAVPFGVFDFWQRNRVLAKSLPKRGKYIASVGNFLHLNFDRLNITKEHLFHFGGPWVGSHWIVGVNYISITYYHNRKKI